MGLERVRHEPVPLLRWEPRRWSLDAGDDLPRRIDCFPLPHSAATTGVDAELVPYDATAPERVRGAVALYQVPLMRIPLEAMAGRATWSYDPAQTFSGATHL